MGFLPIFVPLGTSFSLKVQSSPLNDTFCILTRGFALAIYLWFVFFTVIDNQLPACVSPVKISRAITEITRQQTGKYCFFSCFIY